MTRHDPRIPRETTTAVLKRAQRCCEDCGMSLPLELHHLRYEVFISGDFESIYGQETPTDIDALCRACHHQRHIDPAGSYWKDPQEMKAEWETWFSR